MEKIRTLTDQGFVNAIEKLLAVNPEPTDEEADDYLRSEGLDPEEVVRHGMAVVHKALIRAVFDEVIAAYQGKWDLCIPDVRKRLDALLDT